MIATKQIPAATTTTAGGVARIALAADVTAGTAGPVVDGAAALSLFASATLGALLSNLPTTLPSKSGQAWLNGGVLSVS